MLDDKTHTGTQTFKHKLHGSVLGFVSVLTSPLFRKRTLSRCKCKWVLKGGRISFAYLFCCYYRPSVRAAFKSEAIIFIISGQREGPLQFSASRKFYSVAFKLILEYRTLRFPFSSIQHLRFRDCRENVFFAYQEPLILPMSDLKSTFSPNNWFQNLKPTNNQFQTISTIQSLVSDAQSLSTACFTPPILLSCWCKQILLLVPNPKNNLAAGLRSSNPQEVWPQTSKHNSLYQTRPIFNTKLIITPNHTYP